MYEAVKAITFLKDTETRDDYYHRILDNEIATFVKLQDASENSHNCYLENNTKRAERYQRLIQMLKVRMLRDNKDTPKQLMLLINTITYNIREVINNIPNDENSDTIKSSVIDLWTDYHKELYYAVFLDGDACSKVLLKTLTSTAKNKYNADAYEVGSVRYHSFKGLELSRECIHNSITKFLKKV